MKAVQTTADLVIREVQRMPAGQAVKILTGIHTTKQAERVLASLVRKRHHRRTRRRMQSASRARNR